MSKPAWASVVLDAERRGESLAAFDLAERALIEHQVGGRSGGLPGVHLTIAQVVETWPRHAAHRPDAAPPAG